jgi:hypothetical protein
MRIYLHTQNKVIIPERDAYEEEEEEEDNSEEDMEEQLGEDLGRQVNNKKKDKRDEERVAGENEDEDEKKIREKYDNLVRQFVAVNTAKRSQDVNVDDITDYNTRNIRYVK